MREGGIGRAQDVGAIAVGRFGDIIAEKGDKNKAYEGMSLEAGMLVGPFLAKEQNDVFRRKWMQELQHMEKIESQIQQAARAEENKERLEELHVKIKILKEVLTVG